MKTVILAAGIGSRLGAVDLPKPLVELADGRSLMERQLAMLSGLCARHDVYAVVGYKKDMIMERFPDLTFVYNPNFSTENTAGSLARALVRIEDDVLWLNGDVLVGEGVIAAVLAGGGSAMAVQRRDVGEEEVKFLADETNMITAVAKTVTEGEGEAIGVNYCSAADLPLLRECLASCDPGEYFERGVEMAIERGMRVRAADVSELECIEIDFPSDLEAANAMLTGRED